MMPKKTHKVISLGLIAIMTFQLTACGTIFYPERRGQKAGRIDPVVAIADAIGLFFYFIPGVIAFAVDFATGAIYTGRGKRYSLSPEELKSVIEGGKVNTLALNKILSEKLGQEIDLQTSNVQVKKCESQDQLLALFARTDVQLAGL
ncbi:MAG TPA: polyribonucleotide nucleotidyltransferase [Cellvibrio sp.]|nr:polyribonucleotide nucleotidyltransferase [Cellvibrio sp.]